METKTNSPRVQRAMDNHDSGYNCSQSVALAFADLVDIDEELLLRMASPFGGGVGKMREICGTISGMCLILGALRGRGYDRDKEKKQEFYDEVRALGEQFRAENGTVLCRELLAGVPRPDPACPGCTTCEPRSCTALCGSSAAILESHLRALGIEGL